MAWFIYTLHDPREPTSVRYVGWTKDPAIRLKSHLRRARDGKDHTYCGNWKRSLLNAGVVPILTVIESGFGPGWEEAEVRWIAYFRSIGAKLTNLADGGGGPVGCHWTLSEETRTKMKVSNKRVLTESAKASLSAARKGVPQKPEHIVKSSAARRGKRRTAEAVHNSAQGHVGLTHTEATKAKIRAYHASLRSTPKPVPQRSPESRARTSEALKMYYAKNGTRKHTEEVKSKLSSSLKSYHSRP